MDGSGERQRVDKWLWHARIVRTRSAAAVLVTRGHVRVNGERTTSPSRLVRPGDVVTVALDRSVRLLKVLAITERRGPPGSTAALFETLNGAREQNRETG
jgi:ribosome-associated heat shock protein Hsp15